MRRETNYGMGCTVTLLIFFLIYILLHWTEKLGLLFLVLACINLFCIIVFRKNSRTKNIFIILTINSIISVSVFYLNTYLRENEQKHKEELWLKYEDAEFPSILNVNNGDIRDSVVRRFILDYNDISESPIESVRYYTSYIGYSYDYEIDIDRDEEGYFHIRLRLVDSENTDITGMEKPFRDVIMVLKSSLSKEEISQFFKEIVYKEKIGSEQSSTERNSKVKLEGMEAMFSDDWFQGRKRTTIDLYFYDPYGYD